MRRSIFILALCSLFFVPTFAQEAFYIYRNDGDFNGFFYDEVVEMRYSKIDLDSVEHDNYIMYEVELADTLYRIPLAAIDSIGFQQPEIKINPRVKFMGRDGYCDYFSSMGGQMTSSLSIYFRNLPDNMIPQVGDVIIGLPTDPIAEEEYDGGIADGSFSMKVESVRVYDNEDYDGPFIACNIKGAPIENISDVFDQYITVEQIGVDQQGNVRRRIAGCTPDGLPRPVKKAEGQDEITLINTDVQLIREWQANENAKFDLTADIGVKYKLRAAYNITWSRFYVKISHDLILKVKPSLGMQVSRNVEVTLDDWWVRLPKIMFPAACPVFETDPVPVPFIRAEGTLEARLNLPAVQMGIGDDIIFDSKALFPVSFGLHLLPDEDKELTDDMLDLSTNVTLAGYVQTGILFKANISTANWFKKVLMGDVGLYLYCGPKVSSQLNLGSVTYDGYTNGQEYRPYEHLRQSYLAATLLSLDLEAKAKAAAFWQDPVEKTFLKKNWAWLTDTAFFAPSFEETTIDTTGGSVKITLHKEPKAFIGYTTVEIGICKAEGYLGTGPLIKTVGHFTLSKSREDNDYTYTMTKEDFDGMTVQEYCAFPYVNCGPWGPYRAIVGTIGEFYPPVEYNVLSDHLEFNGNEGDTASVSFTSNCLPDRIGCLAGNTGWIEFVRLEVQDSIQHKYRAVFKAKFNNTLFDRYCDKNHRDAPSIRIWGRDKTIYINLSAHQKNGDLSRMNTNMSFSAGASSGSSSIGQTESNISIVYNGPVTATRQGDNAILITGTATATKGEVTETVQIAFTVEKTNGGAYSENGRPVTVCTSGTMSRHAEDTTKPEEGSGYTFNTDAQYTFTTAEVVDDYISNGEFTASYSGKISGTWDHQETEYYIYNAQPGQSTRTYHLDITPDTDGSSVSFAIKMKPASAQ